MSKQKKIMLLGGIHYLLPVIQAAHEQGYYVITADYLPDNIAHKYSDEYCNVNIVNKDAVLAEAQKRNIDGIISFGVDPGVVAAAYVQEKMHLPQMGPYESVVILQNKDLFRSYLSGHNFNVPASKSYSSKQAAMADITNLPPFPLIVKPTDSAGSKGVTRIDGIGDYERALDEAFSKSISGHVIVEEFIEKQGCSSDTDSFLLNGEFRFVSFNAQHFDEKAANPYTPAAYSWPSTFTKEQEAYLTSELQRLLGLLHMQTSVFNIETRIGANGKPYIMECTPRGGGNRLCEMLRYATGVDLITAQVRAAVGDSVEGIEQKHYDGYWAEVILHAHKEGVFQAISIAEQYSSSVKEIDLWVKTGEHVYSFRGANNAIGTLALRFEIEKQMLEFISNVNQYVTIDIL